MLRALEDGEKKTKKQHSRTLIAIYVRFSSASHVHELDRVTLLKLWTKSNDNSTKYEYACRVVLKTFFSISCDENAPTKLLCGCGVGPYKKGDAIPLDAGVIRAIS